MEEVSRERRIKCMNHKPAKKSLFSRDVRYVAFNANVPRDATPVYSGEICPGCGETENIETNGQSRGNGLSFRCCDCGEQFRGDFLG